MKIIIFTAMKNRRILHGHVFVMNQTGVIIIPALFCMACDSWTDCFHTLAMSIDDMSHDVR